MLPDLQMEEIVRLRKVHPCGSFDWKIVRLGADIGLECLGCGRRILLPRRQLARQMKSRQAPAHEANETFTADQKQKHA
jgi:hypothetical protein